MNTDAAYLDRIRRALTEPDERGEFDAVAAANALVEWAAIAGEIELHLPGRESLEIGLTGRTYTISSGLAAALFRPLLARVAILAGALDHPTLLYQGTGRVRVGEVEVIAVIANSPGMPRLRLYRG